MNSYFETSALVKLLLEERDSDEADDLWDASEQVLVSRIAYPEGRAALAMAARVGRLTSVELAKVKVRFHAIWRQLRLIEFSEDVAAAAGDLSEEFGLRGYDAVHLASALALEDENLVLVTWDLDLSRAGSGAGLRTAPALA